VKLNSHRATVAGIERDFENTSAIPFHIRAWAVEDRVTKRKGDAATKVMLQRLQGMRPTARDEMSAGLEELSGDLPLP
jgi:hypothetical protein